MKPTILVVDDSAAARYLLVSALPESRYRVLQAADGLEALRILSSEAVDLVLTDINMPEMDGLTLIAEVRRSLPRSALCIVVVSTEHEEQQKARARALGASAWLVKPFSPSALTSVLERLLPAQVSAPCEAP